MQPQNKTQRTFLKIVQSDTLTSDLHDFLLDVQTANRAPSVFDNLNARHLAKK